MFERTLRNCRVLIVEDEYFLADELRTELIDMDAFVIGPAGTVDDALDLIRAEERIDGAILDISLRGELVFPVADLLIERSVPFLFTTGYDASLIPSRFANTVRCEKPVSITSITRAIGKTIHA